MKSLHSFQNRLLLKAAGLYGSLSGLLVVIVAETCLTGQPKGGNAKNVLHNIIYGVLLYGFGAISTLLITEIGKHTIGRYLTIRWLYTYLFGCSYLF